MRDEIRNNNIFGLLSDETHSRRRNISTMYIQDERRRILLIFVLLCQPFGHDGISTQLPSQCVSVVGRTRFLNRFNIFVFSFILSPFILRRRAASFHTCHRIWNARQNCMKLNDKMWTKCDMMKHDVRWMATESWMPSAERERIELENVKNKRVQIG